MSMRNAYFFSESYLAKRIGGAVFAGCLFTSSLSMLALPTPVFAQSVFARAPTEGFADLVEKVMPAVVSVDASSSLDEKTQSDPFADLPKNSPFRQFFDTFPYKKFGPNWRRHKTLSQGSGFLISSDGYVVTNHHVIKNSSEVTIRTNDGKEYSAKVVGADPKTDLALLKISSSQPFVFVKFSEKKEPRVGDWVVAVGNPFGLGGTVTTGIVSARGRDLGSGPYDDFIQIDAPINKGNSGGPAFNLEGEVIGINTAIYSPSGGSVGIGFAIPAREAVRVIEQLKSKGSVTRGWLGVQIQPVTKDIADGTGLKEAKGALIADVMPRSPAVFAGIKTGDIVLSVNGEAIKDASDLARRVAVLEPKSQVKIEVMRNGQTVELNATLDAMPEDRDLARLEQSGLASSEFLGLTFEGTPDRIGVLVSSVSPGSEAESRGIKVGDIVIRIGGMEVNDPAQLRVQLRERVEKGDRIVLLLVRSGDSQRFVPLPLQEK